MNPLQLPLTRTANEWDTLGDGEEYDSSDDEEAVSPIVLGMIQYIAVIRILLVLLFGQSTSLILLIILLILSLLLLTHIHTNLL